MTKQEGEKNTKIESEKRKYPHIYMHSIIIIIIIITIYTYNTHRNMGYYYACSYGMMCTLLLLLSYTDSRNGGK